MRNKVKWKFEFIYLEYFRPCVLTPKIADNLRKKTYCEMEGQTIPVLRLPPPFCCAHWIFFLSSAEGWPLQSVSIW